MARDVETRLEVVQGEDLRLRFRYRIDGELQDLTEYTVKSQIRAKPRGQLFLDLGPYLTVNEEDPTALDLYVPGEATQLLKRDGVWDLFVGGTRLVKGPVNVRLSVTE